MPPSDQIRQFRQDRGRLVVDWADGHHSVFHYIWLRDNCHCPLCRHTNGQRLLDTAAIPADIAPARVSQTPGGAIEIEWAAGGHNSQYEPAWLRAHCYSAAARAERRTTPTLWGAEIAGRLPRADYAGIAGQEDALRDWLAAIERYGFALLYGVPAAPGMVLEVVKLFGYVRETNYGRLFDVKSVVNPNNLAYTGLALGGHTDNPYRDPTPSLQLLHCLSSSADGGDSTLVDGFRVAESLRADQPEQFALLTRHPVRFRFQDEDTDLSAEFPLISLDARGAVAAVHYNSRSPAPFELDEDWVEPFYAAYRAFVGRLNSAEFQIKFKLEPGDLFIVDNLRVLHGRSGFSAAGQRHLQGCYADRDGLRSRLAVLNRARKTLGA
jgi:gamma-butyrobetaine hydroxylase